MTTRAHITKALGRRATRVRKEVLRVNFQNRSKVFNWCGALLTIVICVLHGVLVTSVMIGAVACISAESKGATVTTRPLSTRIPQRVLDRKDRLLGPANHQLVVLLT